MPDSVTPDLIGPAAFRDMVNAFQQSRVVLTAYELDLFSALGDGARSSDEVAAAIAADARATDRLMNALVAMGLLRKRNGRFLNGPFAARHLVRGQPGYLAGLMHSVNLWTRWSSLTDAVRAGGRVVPRETGAADERWREAFIAAMHGRASEQAPQVVAGIDLSGVEHVLDAGGGSGAFAMAFVRARAGLRATVFDLPDIVPIARRYIEQAGLADRVEVVSGDLTRDELGRGFDLVFISAIVHMFPADENRRLLEKAVRALDRGGRVVVSDFLINEGRTGPLQPALFALNMLVGTPAGDTYTESEIRGWMQQAGLGAIERRDTPFGASLLVGRRP